jgi:hypothetical protein
MLNPVRQLFALAPLALACGLAWGQSADFKAGYEAGYKAALEALRSGATTPAAAPGAAPAPPGAAPAPAVAQAAPPAAPAGPPDWWNHSALIYPDLHPEWRHRLEILLAGNNLNGNDNGFAIRGGAKLYSRTGRWTNDLKGNIDRRRILQAGGANNVRDYLFLEESVRYDLTDKAYASAGFILERDDVNYIDRRGTVLGGLGYYLVDNPKMRVNLFAGLGALHETYMEPVPSLIGVSSRNSGLLYLYQTFDWQLSPTWSVQQGIRYMRDFDKSGVYGPDPSRPGLYRSEGEVNRFRTVASVGLTYHIDPRSSITLSVESRYDSNPWPEVEPHDIARRLVFNLLY